MLSGTDGLLYKVTNPGVSLLNNKYNRLDYLKNYLVDRTDTSLTFERLEEPKVKITIDMSQGIPRVEDFVIGEDCDARTVLTVLKEIDEYIRTEISKHSP